MKKIIPTPTQDNKMKTKNNKINSLDKFHLVYKTTTTPFFPICMVGNGFSGRFEKLAKIDIKPKEVVVIINQGAVNWFFDENLKIVQKSFFMKFLMTSPYLRES